jgi:hypothetical protein
VKHLIAALTVLATLAPGQAFAHPGHGHTDPQSWAHYLTEPLHVAMLAATAALVLPVLLVRRARRRRSRADAE